MAMATAASDLRAPDYRQREAWHAPPQTKETTTKNNKKKNKKQWSKNKESCKRKQASRRAGGRAVGKGAAEWRWMDAGTGAATARDEAAMKCAHPTVLLKSADLKSAMASASCPPSASDLSAADASPSALASAGCTSPLGCAASPAPSASADTDAPRFISSDPSRDRLPVPVAAPALAALPGHDAGRESELAALDDDNDMADGGKWAKWNNRGMRREAERRGSEVSASPSHRYAQ